VIFTRIAVALGIVVLGALIWLAAAGFKPAVAPLVTLAALVVLVAGGNWISSNFSIHHGGSLKRYAPDEPNRSGSDAEGPSLTGRDARELEE
jgi:hypothetical protein